MSTVIFVLLKNLALLFLVIANVVFIFTNYIGYKQSTYLFIGLGAFYLLTSFLEALVLSKPQANSKKFNYLTDAYLSKRFIKVITFVCCGVVLLISGSIIKYLAYLCFTIAITDVIITLVRYFGKWSFVAISDDVISISTNKLITLRANEIEKIEFRHGLTYVITKDKNTVTIRTDNMKGETEFVNALINWINSNSIILVQN